ncbi:MAG TPA: hypothetical protein VF631_09835 [Allosphingosinicella sp.]|jgi:hypothetical protein|uniref:hypothetical protein n=1 Tax=Allosphingosinicella sp. TaxID=2823234 RepID=UPI002F29CF64
MSADLKPMKRRGAPSKQRQLRKHAQRGVRPASLPLVHVTATGWAREIVETKQLDSRPCRIFGRRLVYFFVLRPAYRSRDGDAKSHQINRFPFVFLFRPEAVPDPFHVYPFDTGGAADGIFSEEADEFVFLEDFELEPSHEAAVGHIAWAFGSLEEYFDGNLRHDLMEGVPIHETVTRGFHDIARLARIGSNQPDKRASAVEVAASHNVPLSGNVLLAVVPRQYLEDDGSENTSFLAQLRGLGIPWRTYEWQPNTAPNEFQDEISRIVRRFYQEEKILR